MGKFLTKPRAVTKAGMCQRAKYTGRIVDLDTCADAVHGVREFLLQPQCGAVARVVHGATQRVRRQPGPAVVRVGRRRH